MSKLLFNIFFAVLTASAFIFVLLLIIFKNKKQTKQTKKNVKLFRDLSIILFILVIILFLLGKVYINPNNLDMLEYLIDIFTFSSSSSTVHPSSVSTMAKAVMPHD